MHSNARIRELYQRQPKNLFLWLSAVGFLLSIATAWWQLDIQWDELFSDHQARNLRRFAGEIYPFPLRGKPFEFNIFWGWLYQIWTERGSAAAAATFHISIVAIILAGFTAILFLFPASRNVATAEPFLQSTSPPPRWKLWCWSLVVGSVRSLFVVMRSIPEYIWAFLLIALLGLNAWPAVLALAIHNFGILGKLGAEVVENTNAGSLRALRAQGLSRAQIAVVGIFPTSLSKWLLFFFYRWETCIREATVLGMLGIASLGYEVNDSRVRDWYDEMLVFMLIGAVLVLLVDLASALTRRYMRRA